MFAEVKSLLPIDGNDYDAEIVLQIQAGAADLTKTADVILPGEISISIDAETGAVTDESTITDPYVIRAIALWCACNIGNPPNLAQLLAAYVEQKGAMSKSSDYTDYGTGE